jgi:hypothetical protein
MKEQYPVIDRVAEVAGRLGRFLFTTPEVHPYMSEHYRGASEMLDSHMSKEQTAAYYVAMAREAAE